MQSQTTGQDFKKGAVAQSVEQRTENPCVAGSIPAHTTSKASEKSGAFLFYTYFFVLFIVTLDFTILFIPEIYLDNNRKVFL